MSMDTGTTRAAALVVSAFPLDVHITYFVDSADRTMRKSFDRKRMSAEKTKIGYCK